jgi:quercetin dioxygenase-like cupin family protein
MAGVARRWMFLGVAVDVLTEPGAPVVVAEAELPEGASPPMHVHDRLDDSFYLLDGRLMVRCGNDVFLAERGTWVQFPKCVPHTFRVLDGPARILLVHADDSFILAVKAIGRPACDGDAPTTGGGPSAGKLEGLLAGHGITNVGPPIEQHDADAWLRARTG